MTGKTRLSAVRYISYNDFLKLHGIIKLANDKVKELTDLEKAALSIVKEVDHNGRTVSENDGGHVSDTVWGERDVNQLLDILGIDILPYEVD